MLTERLLKVLSPLAMLMAWELCAQLHWIDVRFFPPPSSVARSLFAMAATGELWRHLSASLWRIFAGFLIGAVPGIALGMMMGLSRWVRAIVSPIVAGLYPIPKSAILPLILLIFGLGEASKIAMVAIGVFFLVVVNTMAGVLEIDRLYFDVGRNFGASRFRTFATIALPGALPLVLTGIKLGMGMGLILVVVAEMVGARTGLGFMILNAWTIFAVDRMYVGLILTAVLGFLFTVVLEELEQWLVPWKGR